MRAALILVSVLILTLFASVPPSYATTTPTISQSFAATGTGVTVLSVNIPVAPLSGDAIVVFEWFGTTGNGNTACNFILTPSDSQGQAWGAIGNCQKDTLTGGMRAFSVASYSSNQPDTVNCNFGGPNSQIESCYVFDISSPGTITLIGSASGSSRTIQLSGNPLTALPNSLELAAAGIEAFCQPVGVGAGFSGYNPSSACSASAFGLSGEYIITGAGGVSSNFPMTIGQNCAWAELVVQVAQPTIVTTTTIFTGTVVGWLAPDPTHFSNTLILIILPLMGMVFGIFPFTLGKRPQDVGDRAIFPALIGLTLGSALADLSVSNASVLQIPFADVLMAAVLAFLWWWQS